MKRGNLRALPVFAVSLLAALLLAACRPTTDDAPPAASVVVTWATASEVDLLGFNLYRSDRLDGEYVQINDELILGSDDPIAGGEYEYLDDDVAVGQTYYYKLEDIGKFGESTFHGPIIVTATEDGPIPRLLDLYNGPISLLTTLLAVALLVWAVIRFGLHRRGIYDR